MALGLAEETDLDGDKTRLEEDSQVPLTSEEDSIGGEDEEVEVVVVGHDGNPMAANKDVLCGCMVMKGCGCCCCCCWAAAAAAIICGVESAAMEIGTKPGTAADVIIIQKIFLQNDNNVEGDTNDSILC